MSESTDDSTATQWDQVFQQAVQLHGSGQLSDAGTLFAAIVEHNPAHFPSLHRLAAIRRHQDRLEESLSLLRQAIGCNPTSADAHNSLGNTLNALGRQEEAIDQYRCALAIRQDYPEAQLNLANSLKALGRYEEAATAYSAVIALRPQFAEAHGNLGIVMMRMNRPQDAIASYTAALSLDPGAAIVYSNLGLALTAVNRHEEAIPLYQRARQLDPNAPQAIFNESIARLAMGDFEPGWRDYESRWRASELAIKLRDFPQPMWDGQTKIEGKTVLLHAEQGLGDMILFARFARLVVERGARVILEVHKPLLRLMSTIPGVTQVLAYGDPLPNFDLQVPFGSLPFVFKTTIETIPSRVPYLTAPAESPTIASLNDASDGRPRVGVCWAGNPSYPDDRNRSIALSAFSGLFRTPGIRFVSLQQNLRPGDDRILAGFESIDLTSDRKGSGLADTAALISKLDLVITVDTVIGHLAGALGRPVWIFLPYNAHWAWLRHRSDSPWYPTAELFRQSRVGEWESAIDHAGTTLNDLESEAQSAR